MMREADIKYMKKFWIEYSFPPWLHVSLKFVCKDNSSQGVLLNPSVNAIPKVFTSDPTWDLAFQINDLCVCDS